MKVLVTGAFGFFGSHLTRWLAEAGHDVTGVGNAPRVPIALPERVRTVFGDVRNTDLLVKMDADRFDAVVHLAGGGGPAKVAANPVNAVRRDVLGTMFVAAFIRAERHLFASSIYVYPPRGGLCAESSLTAPETLYGAIKEAAEAAWWATQPDATVVRFAHLYGRGPIPHLDVVSRFCDAARAGQTMQVRGAGTQRMDLLHVDDACAAVAHLLVQPERMRLINVGSGQAVTVAELARRCAPADQIVHVAADGTDDIDRQLDISVARAIGWAPKITLEQGIRRMFDEP